MPKVVLYNNCGPYEINTDWSESFLYAMSLMASARNTLITYDEKNAFWELVKGIMDAPSSSNTFIRTWVVGNAESTFQTVDKTFFNGTQTFQDDALIGAKIVSLFIGPSYIEPITSGYNFDPATGTIYTTSQINNTVMSINAISPSSDDTAGTGWSPAFAIIADGDRRVFQIVDWIGGTGDKPAINVYIGATGFVSDIADAVDVRGAKGDKGDAGDPGDLDLYVTKAEYDAQIADLIDMINSSGGGTPPVLQSATIHDNARNIVELNFSKTLNASSVPATSAFTLTSPNRAISSVAIAGSVVKLTVSQAYTSADASAQVSYAQPVSNPLKDGSGNAVQSFAPAAIDNDIIAPIEPGAEFKNFDLDPAAAGLTVGAGLASYTNNGITFAQPTSGARPIFEETVFPTGGLTFMSKSLEAGSVNSSDPLALALKTGSFSITFVVALKKNLADDIMQTLFSARNTIGENSQAWLGFQWCSTNLMGQVWATFTNYNSIYHGAVHPEEKTIITHTFTRTSSTSGTMTTYVNGFPSGSKAVSGLINWQDAANMSIGGVSGSGNYFGQFTLGRMLTHNVALNATQAGQLAEYLGGLYGIDVKSDYTDGVNVVFAGNSLCAAYLTTNPETDAYGAVVTGLLNAQDDANYRTTQIGVSGIGWPLMSPPNRYFSVLESLYVPGYKNILHVYEDTNELQNHTSSPGAGDADADNDKADIFYTAAKALGYTVIACTMLDFPACNPATFVALNAQRRADTVPDFLHDIDAAPRIGSGNPSDGTKHNGDFGGAGTNGYHFSSDNIHFNTAGAAEFAANLQPLLHDVIHA